MTPESLVSYAFQAAPVPLRIVAWVLSGTLIWILISFPARWAWSVLRDAKLALSGAIRSAQAYLSAWRLDRQAVLSGHLAALVEESSLYKAEEGSGSVHSALAHPIQRVLESAKSLVSDTDVSIRMHRDAVSRMTQDLSRIKAGRALDPSAVDQYIDDDFRHRSSLSRLVVSLGMLLFIIPVNAVMLSQILLATNIIPRVIEGLPFPPSYPIAVVLTMMEAALGWVYHSNSSRAHSDRDLPARFSFPQAGLLVAAAGVASIEGFFYGIVAEPKSGGPGLVLKLVGLDVEARYVFTAWGILIVVVLCSLAAAATSAWFDRVEHASLRKLRGDLDALNKSFERLESQSKSAENKWNNLITLADECRGMLGLGKDVSFLQSAIDALRRDLLSSGNQVGASSSQHESASAHGILARVSLFLGLCAFVWIGLAAVGSAVIGALKPEWPLWLSCTAAVCLGFPCVAAGMLSEPRLLYLRDTSQGLQALTPPSSRLLATVLGGVLAVILLAAAVLVPPNAFGVAVVAATCAALVLLVREVSSSATLVPAVLSRWSLAGLSSLAYTGVFIGSAARWALELLVWGLRVLAQPAFAIKNDVQAP